MERVLTTRTETTTGPRGVRFAALARRIRLFLDIWSERRTLEKLDARLLADIGLERWQAAEEAGRNPWDVPGNRLRSDEHYRLWHGF